MESGSCGDSKSRDEKKVKIEDVPPSIAWHASVVKNFSW